MEKIKFEDKYYYETKLAWLENKKGLIETSNGIKLNCTPCPEFEGEKSCLTPTDALLMSVNICIFTTFLELTSKFRINPKSYNCQTFGEVEVNENPRFTNIIIKPVIEVEKKDLKKTEKAIIMSKKYCLVTNSLNVPIEMDCTIIVKE